MAEDVEFVRASDDDALDINDAVRFRLNAEEETEEFCPSPIDDEVPVRVRLNDERAAGDCAGAAGYDGKEANGVLLTTYGQYERCSRRR